MKQSALTQRVLRATGVFGGAQAVTILCSIVRTKLVALWIGPAGIGLFGLFNMAVELLSQIAQMGMRNSAVRDIAATSDASRRRAVIAAVSRWAIILGLSGALLTILAAPWLSRITFGDGSQTEAFRILAAVILLASVTAGQTAILQGLGRMRRMAKASLIGAVAGVAVSVPLFYWLRIDSIIPSILAYSLATAIATWCLRERTPVTPQPLRETLAIGRSFIILGFFITLSGVLEQLASYIFMSWLNIDSGKETVGFFQAGNTLTSRYVGLIFTAIAVEYFPRLSANISSRRRTEVFVSHEVRLTLLILIPVILIFQSAAPWIVGLLYSPEFEIIVPYVVIAVAGTILRALSWCMAFVILARGDGRIYLLTESVSALAMVPLYITGYRLAGVAGFGLAYVAWYALYTAVVFAIFRFRYRLRLAPRVTLLLLAAAGIALLSTYIVLMIYS